MDEEWAQVLRATTFCSLLDMMESIEPAQLTPDGEWQIEQWESGNGFSATSRLAITHGPFPWQADLNDLLPTYGLEICNRGTFVQGVSHFPEMRSGCFEDALSRLRWLEDVCMQVNGRVCRASTRMWYWLDEHCRPDLEKACTGDRRLMSPPSLFRLMSTRTRSFPESTDASPGSETD